MYTVEHKSLPRSVIERDITVVVQETLQFLKNYANKL